MLLNTTIDVQSEFLRDIFVNRLDFDNIFEIINRQKML